MSDRAINDIVAIMLNFPVAVWIRGSTSVYHFCCRSETGSTISLTRASGPHPPPHTQPQNANWGDRGGRCHEVRRRSNSPGRWISVERGQSRPAEFITWHAAEIAPVLRLDIARRCSPERTRLMWRNEPMSMSALNVHGRAMGGTMSGRKGRLAELVIKRADSADDGVTALIPTAPSGVLYRVVASLTGRLSAPDIAPCPVMRPETSPACVGNSSACRGEAKYPPYHCKKRGAV